MEKWPIKIKAMDNYEAEDDKYKKLSMELLGHA